MLDGQNSLSLMNEVKSLRDISSVDIGSDTFCSAVKRT